MSKTPNIIKDEYGTWHVYPSGLRALVEPSQKWLDEHPAPEPTPEEPADSDSITAEEAIAILLGGEDA